MDVKFTKPTAQFVVKAIILENNIETSKLFVNMCSSETIINATCKAAKKANGEVGNSWSIPLSFGPLKKDKDASKNI